MKIKKIKAKSIIVKSNLPESNFVINPYSGCSHDCLYCYARFMKRFTNHNEPWGEFVDVKINAPDLIPQKINKYKNKSIVIGSVTDPYLPLESKYQLTRQILKKLISCQPHLDIITKSDLFLRDIDLLKQFNNCTIAISASFLDKEAKNRLEQKSISTRKRLEALKKICKNNIKKVLFVSPIFPEITDWQELIDLTKNFVDEYWFENLNIYPSISNQIYGFLNEYDYNLIPKYKEIYSTGSNYWKKEEKNIKNYCEKNKLNYRIYFHHTKK